MERLISELVDAYEAGTMTRRQLIQGLAAAAAVGASAGAAAAPAPSGFKATGIDHISYLVSDYRRTRDFYVDLLGMEVVRDDAAHQMCELRLGESALIVRSWKKPATYPGQSTVDHFSVYIDDWNTERVRAELARRGHKPRLDTDRGTSYTSFHITDPDGYDLQIADRTRP